MHRIDGPGAVNNLFSEGDPSVPQMATVVTSVWLNDVQENLARAIEAAGITPVKGDYDQLRRAILLLSGSGLIGEGKIWLSETLPADGDWLEGDGSALLIVDYPALFAVYGHSFGVAPAGYFRLPNFRGARASRLGPTGPVWTRTRPCAPGGDHVGSTQEDANKKHCHPMGNGGGTQGSAAPVGLPGVEQARIALQRLHPGFHRLDGHHHPLGLRRCAPSPRNPHEKHQRHVHHPLEVSHAALHP